MNQKHEIAPAHLFLTLEWLCPKTRSDWRKVPASPWALRMYPQKNFFAMHQHVGSTKATFPPLTGEALDSQTKSDLKSQHHNEQTRLPQNLAELYSIALRNALHYSSSTYSSTVVQHPHPVLVKWLAAKPDSQWRPMVKLGWWLSLPFPSSSFHHHSFSSSSSLPFQSSSFHRHYFSVIIISIEYRVWHHLFMASLI